MKKRKGEVLVALLGAVLVLGALVGLGRHKKPSLAEQQQAWDSWSEEYASAIQGCRAGDSGLGAQGCLDKLEGLYESAPNQAAKDGVRGDLCYAAGVPGAPQWQEYDCGALLEAAVYESAGRR